MLRHVCALGLVLGLAACGGEDAAAPPPQPPPAPPVVAPPADTTPAPVATAEPAPQPTLADKIGMTMKGIGDALNAHDAKAFAALYATDAVFKSAGMPDTNGREAIQSHQQTLFDAYPDAKFGARRVGMNTDTAVIEWTMTGTNTGPMHGMPATGKPIGVEGASVVHFNGDGLVKEEHLYMDVGTMLAQLGVSKMKARALATQPAGAPEVHMSKGTPDEAANIDKAKKVDAAFEAHDDKAFGDANADDVSWDDKSSPGPMTGKKAAVDFFKMYTKAFPDLKMACDVWAADDLVFNECTTTGTQKGTISFPGMTIKPTNKSVTTHGLDVIQLKDGKAIKGVTYSNGMEFAEQLGLMPKHGDHGDHGGKGDKKGDAKPAAPKADGGKAPASGGAAKPTPKK